MKVRYVLIFVALSTFALAACSGEEEEAAKRGGGPSKAKVEAQSISQNSLSETRTFMGEVRNSESTVLAAGVGGEVLKVEVLEGDEVTRGTLLAQLDASILRAQLGQAQAELSRIEVDLDQARRDEKRLGTLSDQGYFPSAEAEQIASRRASLEAALQGQRASAQRLREEIAQMRIVAPFDGVVAERHISPGQWIQSGQPAIELTSQGSLEVHIRVPSHMIELVSVDTRVEIRLGERHVEGTVAGMVGSLDRRTRTGLIRIVPVEPKPWLREGDAIDVLVQLERDGGLVIPTDALTYSAAGTRVFRVVDGKAEPVDVEIVAQQGEAVLVSSDSLSLEDSVVTRGNERLRPGQELEVKP